MLRKSTDLRYRIQVETAEQRDDALSCRQAEYVYTPVRLLIPNERIIAVPSVFTPEKIDFPRVLAHTVGWEDSADTRAVTHGGMRLNVTNSLALRQYAELGLADCILSIELSLQRIKRLTKPLPVGIIAYGRLPMMLLRRIPDVGESGGLIDRKGNFLPLIRGNGEAELLNPVPLVLSDKDLDSAGIDFAVLRVTDEGEMPSDILKMYLDRAKPVGDYTRGLYYK
jgi:hypothetical protein